MFDGILGSKYEERLVKLSGYAHYGNGMFLHGFQKSGLSLGGSTVNFVGKYDVAENRTGLELEGRVAVFAFYYDVSTGYVGRHKVGSELYTGERKIENSTERSYQSGFTYAGYAFEKNVTAGNHGDDSSLYYVFHTDDVSLYLSEYVFALFTELLDVFLVDTHNCFLPLLFYFDLICFYFLFCDRTSHLLL